jgi:hypothetical protein
MKKSLITLLATVFLSIIPFTANAATDSSSQQNFIGPTTINATLGKSIGKIYYGTNCNITDPNNESGKIFGWPGLQIISGYLRGNAPSVTGTWHFQMSCGGTSDNPTVTKTITFRAFEQEGITTLSTPRGVFNKKYQFHFQANNPVKGIKWFIPYKNYLPPGLHLSSAGTLYGTPTKTGTYKFTVTVIYPETKHSSVTASRTFTMKIGFNEKEDIITTSIPVGNLNKTYTPFHFEVYKPAKGLIWKAETPLPKGLHLSNAGTLFGNPTEYGTYPVKIEAGYPYKGAYEYVDQSYTLKINYFNDISPLSLPNGRVNVRYPTIHLKLYNPVKEPQWLYMAFFPPGLFISKDGTLYGTPTETGTYNFMIFVNVPTKDGTYQTNRAYTIKITN